jgi:hypothetical protein
MLFRRALRPHERNIIRICKKVLPKKIKHYIF